MVMKLKVPGAQSEIFSEHLGKRTESDRTTFRLSQAAKRSMDIRVTQDGYGLRGKSRWIMNTVEEFLDPTTWSIPGEQSAQIWKRIVIDTELHKEPLVKDAINLPEDLRITLWRAAIEAALYGAEMDEPAYLEISISSVIRAAVMWKLGRTLD